MCFSIDNGKAEYEAEDEDDNVDKNKAINKDKDAVLNSDAIYSATTVDRNYEDDHLSLTSNEEDQIV